MADKELQQSCDASQTDGNKAPSVHLPTTSNGTAQTGQLAKVSDALAVYLCTSLSIVRK